MTGRIKGWLAVVVLALATAGFGFVFTTNRTVRIRFWNWRAHSSDREVRRHARVRLIEIGRPAIDSVFPDLVAGEVCDRIADVPAELRVVFVVRSELLLSAYLEPRTTPATFHCVERELNVPLAQVKLVLVDEPVLDRLARSLVVPTEGTFREIVAGHSAKPDSAVEARLLVRLADDDLLAPTVIEETRSRLAAMK